MSHPMVNMAAVLLRRARPCASMGSTNTASTNRRCTMDRRRRACFDSGMACEPHKVSVDVAIDAQLLRCMAAVAAVAVVILSLGGGCDDVVILLLLLLFSL